MDVKEAIEKRRAYRSLKKMVITDDIIKDLAIHAQLAPSCFNYQPWHYIFVTDTKILSNLAPAISEGNAWSLDAPMVVAVFSKKDRDCVIKGREYYLFDTGMATAFLILRATEMGLVAHPIAGFAEDEVKRTLNIPPEFKLITLLIVGKKSNVISNKLSKKMAQSEKERPSRKPFSQFAFMNTYSHHKDQ